MQISYELTLTVITGDGTGRAELKKVLLKKTLLLHK